MASWHERDCRRPDVLLMDNVPTCLSCGSLFAQSDETQGEPSKQTTVVEKASSRLNLDWPSSITFYGPDDVTDPDLRGTLLALDRYIENADADMVLTEEHSVTAIQVGHSATSGDSRDVKENAPTEGHGTQSSVKKSEKDPNSGGAKLDITSPNSVYQSLMGSDEIRLLHLDPQESASQPLHGNLRTARLSMRPDYIALSYTWADMNGDRTLCDKIFLGNAWAPFAITSNCGAALRRLRLRGGTCVVWVDAICIDQSNIGERSHQVSMMRDIYSRAESVSIFLGGDANDDIGHPAHRLLQRLSEDRFHAGKEVTSDWGRQFDTQEVRDLFEQPYWSRIWVIQEVLLARQAEIILGHASVSLQEFITNFMSRMSKAVEGLVPPWIYLSGGSFFGDTDSFLSLLQKTLTCKASDDRDMVFALLGLVQGASLEGLVADYSKTTSEIYIGLTAYFLIRYGYGGLLKAAAAAASEHLEAPGVVERHVDVPSWVSFATFLTSLANPLEPPRFVNTKVDKSLRKPLDNNPVGSASDGYWASEVQPTRSHPPNASLITYQVFRNHGTLLIRAFPVVHMSQMGSALAHGAFTFQTSKMEHNSVCGLVATGTSTIRWGITIHSRIPSTGDDEWIIEAPGCDALLHLKPSGRVHNTYKIVSLSVVTLTSSRHLHGAAIEALDGINPVELAIHDNQLSAVAYSARGSKFWMRLISCGLQHLLFLRHWESNTRMDRLLGPHQPGSKGSLADLSPQVLEKYGRWLEFNHDFDFAVRTVSLYLERWEDRHLWSRIYEIVVEMPWQEKLQELADIKANAWQHLVTRNRNNAGDGEHRGDIQWQQSLRELFEDLISRLPDISLRKHVVGPSLGSFMSMDTCLSLCNSIRNVPDSWTMDDIRSNETEILKDWIGVESCWDFMNRSKVDCRDLRAKFAQLRALRRLCRREQRDFLIC